MIRILFNFQYDYLNFHTITNNPIHVQNVDEREGRTAAKFNNINFYNLNI